MPTVDTNDIAICNDGTMILHNIQTNQFSAIDLSICSSDIFLDINWSVNDYLSGSDHYPIHLDYVKSTTSDSRCKQHVEKADWDKFSKGIDLDSV